MSVSRNTLPRSAGFTLIELLVSATVMAVLTAAGVVAYTSVSRNSRDSKRTSDIEQLRSALEMYRSDNGYYPAVNTGSFGTADSLSNVLVNGGYMPAIPDDPKAGQQYYYRALNQISGNYYEYCLCNRHESLSSTSNQCSVGLPGGSPPAGCNYGRSNP